MELVCCGSGELVVLLFFFFQAEDGIRDLVRSRGLGDVYKRQRAFHSNVRFLCLDHRPTERLNRVQFALFLQVSRFFTQIFIALQNVICLLYTSDAADERSSVDLGGRRIIKKNTHNNTHTTHNTHTTSTTCPTRN